MLPPNLYALLVKAKEDLESVEPWPWQNLERWAHRTRPTFERGFSNEVEAVRFDNLTEGEFRHFRATKMYRSLDKGQAARAEGIKRTLLAHLQGLLNLGAAPDPGEAQVTMNKKGADPKRVFVIHGRDPVCFGMRDFLRALHLAPIEFNAQASRIGGSPSNAEVVRAAIDEAQAVIVLWTPDEDARLSPSLGGTGELERETTLAAPCERHS